MGRGIEFILLFNITLSNLQLVARELVSCYDVFSLTGKLPGQHNTANFNPVH